MSNNLEYLGNLQDSDEIKWKFHSLPLSMVGTLISSENLSMLLTSLEAYSHSGYIGYLFEAMSAWSKYLDMTIEELQAGILAKMAKNGPITDQMRKDVEENIYKNSLLNWIKSFNN